MVSYISYLLFPFPKSSDPIPNIEELEQLYAKVLLQHDNDTFKVLDLVTRDVDSYVFYCRQCKSPSSFFTTQYIRMRKCFVSSGSFNSPTPLLFPKLGLVLTLRSAGKDKPPLEKTIANSEALWSSVLDVAVFDSSRELAMFKVESHCMIISVWYWGVCFV